MRFGAKNILGFPAGINLACLGETIALCQRGTEHNHSIGERLDYQEACDIYDFATSIGFEEEIYRNANKFLKDEINTVDGVWTDSSVFA